MVREEVELLGGAELLLGCRHLPTSRPAAGVVMCSSGRLDRPTDAARAALLARRLANVGLAVQRFHYRGTDASDGDPRALSFGRLLEDGQRATEALRERTGLTRLAFLGMHVGALVAARLARAHRGAPVALWDPLVDPRRLLESVVAGSRAGQSVDASFSGPPLDLLATPLAEELYEGAAISGLVDELGDDPRPVLLVQAGDAPPDATDLEAVAGRCRALGLRVDLLGLATPGNGAPDGADHAAAELVDRTVAWLAVHVG